MPEPKQLEAYLSRIERDGYAVIEGAVEFGLLDALSDDLLRLERDLESVPTKNDFEGEHTVRIYNLLAHGRLYEAIPVHEAVLPVVEGVLDDGCLISSLSSISIDPDETAQPIHADDQLIPLPKPHPAIICNTMWALTDFSEENGATRVVPGSHKSGTSPEYSSHYDSVACEMSRGSVLVWHGSLWHGGGANRSQERRVGIAMNYCAGFIRQQENQLLGVPRETVRGFSPRLRELVGYGVYNSLIGHVDRKNPAELLGEAGEHRMVWDYSASS